MPQLLAAAALLGMFHWTNYWDFVIYFVVTCGVVLFMNIIGQEGQGKMGTCRDSGTGSGDPDTGNT